VGAGNQRTPAAGRLVGRRQGIGDRNLYPKPYTLNLILRFRLLRLFVYLSNGNTTPPDSVLVIFDFEPAGSAFLTSLILQM
jgi:hypothetical protein